MTLTELLDAYLYPIIETSRDGHTANATAEIMLRDGTRMTWAEWKAQVRIAAAHQGEGTVSPG